MAFIDCTEQQIQSRQEIMKEGVLFLKEKETYYKTQLMDNNHWIVIHKLDPKKGRKHDYIFKNIKIIIPVLQKMLHMY